MSEKVKTHHLKRKAVLYIRQSTQHQLRHNLESRRLQYAMQDRLQTLGWTQVDVIDEDLGRSAGGTSERTGFQRMVAEVGLGKVGAVAAREVSRFARNSRDWQQLVEICRLVDTLLIDQDAVYDARQSNDRLLLGLKGTLNEYELDLLRLRGYEAKQEKARRGEYYARVPIGYRRDGGTLEKDPDRRIRQAVEIVFDRFFELGSATQLLVWMNNEGLQMPRGRRGGSVIWKQPAYHQLIHILKNPTYAGCYSYNRTMVTHQLQDGKPRRVVVPSPKGRSILIPEHHEGYISIEQFERIQRMIEDNAQLVGRSGAAKEGPALLTGLLRCRRCGHKLSVNYSGPPSHRVHRYSCRQRHASYGESLCIGFSGLDVDRRIAVEVLDVVQPAAVEAALIAANESLAADDQVIEALRAELEGARYAADRAWRQYDATDPENRLVADELERRWNDALERVRDIEERVRRHEVARERTTIPGAEVFESLASDLQSVWNDSNVEMKLRKRIARALIEEIVVDVDDEQGQITLFIHWKGGVHTELKVRKYARGENRAHTPDEVIEAIRVLALVCNDLRIAHFLGRNGIRTAQGKRWSKTLVTSLRSKRQIPCYSEKRRQDEGWMTQVDAAGFLGVAELTVKRAVEQGVVKALHPLPTGPRIFRKADLTRPEVLSHFEERRARGQNRRDAPPAAQLSLKISDT